MNDIPRAEAERVVQRPVRYWMYFWNHHTSTWWAAFTAVVGTFSSSVLGAWLARLAVRLAFARSKVVGAFVAVVCWSVWLCGATFLLVLALVICFAADLEGTQTEVRDPYGTPVVITVSNSGYHWVRVWRRDAATRYVEEPGPATVDPSNGPCTLTGRGKDVVLTCGTTSQTLRG